jgi:hypothetical protein
MLRAVATRPLLLVLTACALAGCGDEGPSDEEQIRSTLTQFERATAAGDYEALCKRVLASTLVETVKQIGLPCEVALEKGFEDVDEPRLSVGTITVKDGTASAQVRSSASGQTPSEDTVKLVKDGAAWKIASLGDAPGP